MRTVYALMVVLAGCATPTQNEVVGGLGRARWSAPIASATFANGLVQVELGAPTRVKLEIPSCYPHAHSKIGDSDKITIELDHISATAGQLDITDCTTQHLTATMWATFPDGSKIDAVLDTPLAH